MVAKGEDDKPTAVPELVLEDHEQVKRFIECMRMKEIKQSVKEQMNDAKSHIEVKDAARILADERCIIRYNTLNAKIGL